MKKTSLAAFGLVLTLASGAAFAADAPTPPAGGPGGHEGKHRMFEETDTNKDGSLSKDEWRAKGDKMFAEIDTDKDGKLSGDEMKAHHVQMREKFKAMRAERGEKGPDHGPDGKTVPPHSGPDGNPAPEAKPIPHAK